MSNHARNHKLSSIKIMKTISCILPVMTVLTLAALPAMAQELYTGSGVADGSPTDGAAISSVLVNNDANNISFTINSVNPQASWNFYAVEIQQVGQGGSGSTALLSPFGSWGPVVGISSGENAVIDTFGSYATPYMYSGGWSAGANVNYSAGGTGSTFTTFAVPLSSLGLSVGSSFYFDVVSSYNSWANGGPQGAYSALDNPGYPEMTDNTWSPWDGGAGSYDSATSPGSTFGSSASEYTVAAVVPEPSTCVLMGLGALAMIRRSLSRKV
jgi:hypothetical protein